MVNPVKSLGLESEFFFFICYEMEVADGGFKT